MISIKICLFSQLPNLILLTLVCKSIKALDWITVRNKIESLLTILILSAKFLFRFEARLRETSKLIIDLNEETEAEKELNIKVQRPVESWSWPNLHWLDFVDFEGPPACGGGVAAVLWSQVFESLISSKCLKWLIVLFNLRSLRTFKNSFRVGSKI